METLRKRIFYKATHRGMHETDKIIGGFAVQELKNLSEVLLYDFDKLLDVPDVDLLNWILGRDRVPRSFDNRIFQLIIAFKESL
ncbi:MAG TPA: succinate dehydrogenase assembly factor 2 [Rhodospirillales bacterium]|nr:succinate dehydrogenase assembly factor 2 [Rhodospirillales bacterium]HIL74089.1 succinate dehydrogenase assembly factor 2 [Rhodospirillales bacterium]